MTDYKIDYNKRAIIRFDGAFSFLSNFYPARITLWDTEFSTAEHAYQASKAKTHADRIVIANLSTPGKAKRAGQKLLIQPGWKGRRTEIMRSILVEKFKIPALRELLLSTNDTDLVEGNHWGDTFWGVCNGVGENNLGKLLMEIRAEIRQEEDENV